jgi:hypothetical protein
MITSIYSILSICPTLEWNHVISRVAYVGIMLLKDELPHSLTISWLLERKSREVWSLKVHRTKITRFAWLEGFRFRNHTCYNILSISKNFNKSYWVCIHNVGDFHTRNHLPFFLVLEQVDHRRLEHMWLLGYLEDDMSHKLRCLIPMKSNRLQRFRKFKKNRSLLGLNFP